MCKQKCVVWCVVVCGLFLGACGEGEVSTSFGGVGGEDKDMRADMSSMSVQDMPASVTPDLGGEPSMDQGGVLPGRDMSVVADMERMLDMGGMEQPDQGVDLESMPVDQGPPITTGPGSAGCQSAGARHAGGKWTLRHDGLDREFYVELPASYDSKSPAPVVFDFHGRNMSASTEDLLTNMASVGTARGFVVVHPEGTGGTWNAGTFCCGSAQSNNVDDVGFTLAMIEELSEQLCVRPDGIFITGMSNGGFMSHTLGCQLAGRVAAIAPVAGTMANFSCGASEPVSVFHFHGTDDNVVPYDGYDPILGTDSVDTAIETWIDENDCDTTGQVFFDRDDVKCTEWSGCKASRAVRLCKIRGGGHTWPGGTSIPGLGRTTMTISATEMMLDFFLAHFKR